MALGGDPANGASVKGAHVNLGPLLFGAQAVWDDAAHDSELFALAPNGAQRTLLSMPPTERPKSWLYLAAASPSRILVAHTETDETGSEGSTELLAGTPNGDFRSLETRDFSPDANNCALPNVALDGDLLVEANQCPGRPLSTRDLATPDAPPATVPWDAGSPRVPLRVLSIRAAGRYAAVLAEQGSGWPPTVYVVLVDLVTGAEVYRVPYGQLLGPNAPANYEIRYDLDPDGTVVIELPDYDWQYGRRANLYWMSPAEPSIHQIATHGGAGLAGFGLAMQLNNGRIAVRRQEDWALVNLRGDTLEVFDTDGDGGTGLDFDGHRLVWASGDTVWNEPYPLVASSAPQAPVSRGAVARVSVRCTTSQRCTGTLALKAQHTGHRFGSAQFTIPPQSRRTIPVKLSSRARQTLARTPTLHAAAALRARGSGISIQSTRPVRLHR